MCLVEDNDTSLEISLSFTKTHLPRPWCGFLLRETSWKSRVRMSSSLTSCSHLNTPRGLEACLKYPLEIDVLGIFDVQYRLSVMGQTSIRNRVMICMKTWDYPQTIIIGHWFVSYLLNYWPNWFLKIWVLMLGFQFNCVYSALSPFQSRGAPIARNQQVRGLWALHWSTCFPCRCYCVIARLQVLR